MTGDDADLTAGGAGAGGAGADASAGAGDAPLEPLLARTVPPEAAGERADTLLAAWLGESRGRTQRRLAAGEVAVDGAVIAKSHRFAAGERVVVAVTPPPAPVAPDPVPVRYEDEHLLVVAKPAGLVVHPGAGTEAGAPTLVAALQAMGRTLAPAGGEERPGIVHRLDRGTSGLLAVAKSDAAFAGLTAALQRREVRRGYWALAEGTPREASATIDAAIARDPRVRSRFHTDPAGRPALTHYDLVEDLGRASVLAVRLETGRTHQVRVHLSAIGHPVVGDRTYGAARRFAEELGLQRPALHAASLALTHPVTGEPVTVEEPLPDDLVAAVAALRAARH